VALVGQIEQATRAGDQHIEALGYSLHLGIHADTAKDAGAFHRQVAGIQLEAVMHLGGQFAGGRQHQHARLFRTVAVFPIGMTAREENFQNRQGETTGLAGARLGGDHQIAALQRGGDGPLLHWSGRGVSGSLESAGYSLGETEGSKGHGKSCM
jgi:hypothetical protein